MMFMTAVARVPSKSRKQAKIFNCSKNIVIYHLFMYLIRVILDFVQNCRVKTNVENIGALSRLSSSTTTGIYLFVSK